ncbi:MAG: kinesin-like nuclear fusion protein [Chrysothrix sp. TS-e1954]|nr:MAG: kinesin-like nuclear fusion protein [Chrysothrix sp. TS-e1954]
MDENMDPNNGVHASRSSKLPTPASRNLHEISESETNARAYANMPPPNALPVKHKLKDAPESEKKRTTLVDRVDKFPATGAGPSSSKSGMSNIQPSTLTGMRNPSGSSSHSRYFSSSSSRNTSNGSMNSAGSGMRPPSAQSLFRPQSAFGQPYNRQNVGASSIARPASSVEVRQDDKSSQGRRKGMNFSIPLPSRSETPLQIQKLRRRYDYQGDDIYTSRSSSGATLSQTKSSKENPFRNTSISAAMSQLSLRAPSQEQSGIKSDDSDASKCPQTPSYIPKPNTPVPDPFASTPSEAPERRSRQTPSPTKSSKPIYLTKHSNVPVVIDTQGSIDEMENGISTMSASMAAVEQRSVYKEFIELYKTRVTETDAKVTELTATNAKLQGELEETKVKLCSTTVALEDSRRSFTLEIDDLRRKHRNEMEDARDQQRREEEIARRTAHDDSEGARRKHMDEMAELEQRLRLQVEEERTRRQQELQEMSTQLAAQTQAAELDVGNQQREVQDVRNTVDALHGKLELERTLGDSLKSRITEGMTRIAELEASLEAAQAKAHFLESDSQAQSQAFADLNRQTQEAVESAREANEKLRAEETLRRKLHNQVQELKGNIRVFCRVRPPLDGDDPAKIAFPDASEDSKELVVVGPEHKSATGNISAAKNGFAFDRVFGPGSVNQDVFEEISQLVQSALDGYNVCIFCYGQTGSGKTHTMTSEDGMIPLAVNQIYQTARSLQDKGWSYKMQGSFIEVYNENLNDLLGKADDLDKKKHEIRHDPQSGKTTITDATVLELESPETVVSILKRASANRSVAATKANERSSRSHSVFILKLTGENTITGERSEGTLNLVDLAGSERLNQSGATGDRLKETQNINRSLSSLGDVISALGQGKDGGHIPYRNSKLTYLLQHSLGGNSKTLMFVMISPLQAHLNETLTSLKFATKVHNTHIGTAKKQTKGMEKYSQYRDKGSGIAPFFPIPQEPSGVYLPFHLFLVIFRIPFLLTIGLSYFLCLQYLPIGPLGRKAALWAILSVPGIWWVDLQIDGVRRGSLSKATSQLPRPGSILVASTTSPLDALYLAAIFDPIFTISFPHSKLIIPVSLFRAILQPLLPSSLALSPPTGSTSHLTTLPELAAANRDRVIVVAPECSPTNGRAILPLSPSLLSVPPEVKIFPTSLRYTPADVTTPLPGVGAVVRFLWNLCSRSTHTIRVRIAEPVRNSFAATSGHAEEEVRWRKAYEEHKSPTRDAINEEWGEHEVKGDDKRLLDRVGEALARLGRVKRVSLGVKEKADFVQAWRKRGRW